MNLLQNRINTNLFDYINPLSFRKNQYNRILPFIENAINFLSQQYNEYLEIIDISIQERVNYMGVYNSKFSKVEIITKNKIDNKESVFTTFYVPTLLMNNYFYLNGCYYLPCLYLVDYPISVKKKSMKISSMFNSITFYQKDEIVIFTRRNFTMESFIQLFLDYDDDDYVKYRDKISKTHQRWDTNNLIEFFSKKFSIHNKSIENIIEKIENLFFDSYTYYLYKTCYSNELKEDFGIKDVIRLALKESLTGKKEFNDLNYKRITLLEMLLRPFLDKISSLATEVSKGIPKDQMKMDELLITKYFLTSVDTSNPTGKKQMGLSGNYIYDTKNLYSSILQPKATFLTPGMETPPAAVKHLHKTHYGRICPITVSSQKPGETISLISDVELDEFGLFT